MTEGQTKLVRVLVTLAVLATIGAIGWHWWNNYTFSDKYDLEFSGKYFRVTGMHTGTFELYLDITSHYSFPVTINGYDITVRANGTQIARMTTGSSYVPQPILPRQKSRITLHSDFDPASMAKTILNRDFLAGVFASKTDTQITFSGTASMRAIGVDVDNVDLGDITMPLSDLLPSTIPS